MNTSLVKEKRNIKFLEFEINNQCQYTAVHNWCPRNRLGTEPLEELKTEVITKVMKQFKDFDGSVYFSNYNEPTTDKRFESLIKKAKKEMPKCAVQMFTNGVDLTADKAESYFKTGLDILRMSGYSKSEHNRLIKILVELKNRGIKNYMEVCNRMYSGWLGHDDRVNIYNRIVYTNMPCYMPIQFFMICSNGNVIPCFDDWKQTVVFGNVYKDKVDDILMNPVRLELIEKLKQGKRESVVCKT